MLLSNFRKNIKIYGWVIVSILILAFSASFGISNFMFKKNYAAEVFGKKISQEEFIKFQKTVIFSKRFRSLESTLGHVNKDILDNTTLQFLAFYMQAKKDRIKISDDKVRQEILSRFSVLGVFDPSQYDSFLNYAFRGNARHYEEGIRTELIIEKVIENLRLDATVTDEDIRNAIKLEQTEYQIDYIFVPSNKYVETINPSEEELRIFYENNKTLLQNPDRFDINFIHVKSSDFLDKITITDEEAHNFFNESQKLNPNSSLIFEDVKTQIKSELKSRKSLQLAKDKAKEVQEKINETKNFSTGAELINTKVMRTGLKSIEELEKVFGPRNSYQNQLKEMENNAVKIISTPSGSFVMLLTNREYPYTPPFEEIKSRVKTQFVNKASLEKSIEEINTINEKLITENNSLKTLKEAYPFYSSKLFSGKNPVNLERIGSSSKIINLINQNSGSKVLPFIQTSEGIVLIEVTQIREVSKKRYSELKEEYESRLLLIKQNTLTNNGLQKIINDAQIKNLMNKQDLFPDITEENI